MFGVPVDGPAFIYGDNQSVLANTTKPESTIKKKSQTLLITFFEKVLRLIFGGHPTSMRSRTYRT